jgi:hypothetical protein
MTTETKQIKETEQSSSDSEDFDLQENLREFDQREVHMETGSWYDKIFVAWPVRLMKIFDK